MSKHKGTKFSASVRLNVLVDVPLKATDWATAVEEAEALNTHEVYEVEHELIDFERVQIEHLNRSVS